MSEKKIIKVNPALFSISKGNNTTRKKVATEPKNLKLKSSGKSPHETKTLRNRLLHYIRKNQEDNFKKLHGKSEITVPDKKILHTTETFNNEFEESLKYMNEIADQVKHSVNNEHVINQTLRNYKSLNPESVLSGVDFDRALPEMSTDIPVFTDLPPITNMTDYVNIKPTNYPQWGCMKGGSLPTYKMWKNQTQHNREPIPSAIPMQTPSLNLDDNMTISSLGNMSSYPTLHGGKPSISTNTETPAIYPPKPPPISIRNEPEIDTPHFDSATLSQMKQTMDKIKSTNDAIAHNAVKYGKRKKTIRKTYKLGKSRVAPKVSVLISNKTVRKNISTKTEKLKQTPIDEIRSILIKKGFIKVGSLATNDVLRKMYESMLLVCGEVENHNADNLLYNYFNSAH